MKSTLPLFLSLCQSVSLSLVYVSLFAFTMVSLSHVFRYVQTQLRTQHTGASQRHPAVTDQIKRVLKHTALSWVMWLHTHKLSETMSSIYTHADMWLSDKVRPDSPSLQEGRPRVSACASWDSDFWMTSQDNRQKTQQITDPVPVQISHVFYLFKEQKNWFIVSYFGPFMRQTGRFIVLTELYEAYCPYF